MFSVTLDYPDGGRPLQHFDWLRAATSWLDDTGAMLRGDIQEAAPVRSGRLASSIRYERNSAGGATVSGRIGTHVPYAGYVVGGTLPHLIRPVAARSLHWVSGGQGHFARLVHHPGTRANPFARRAIEEKMDRVRDSYRDAMIEAMRR